MQHKGLLKKLTGDSLLYGISTIALRLISFVLFPLFARKFSPDDYGVIGLLTTLNFFVTALCGMGMDSATARWFYDNDDPEYIKKVFSSWLMVQTGASVLITVLLIGYTFIFDASLLLKTPHPDTLVILVCVNILFNIPLSIANLYYVLQRKPLPSVYFSVSSALLSAVASLFLVFKLNLGLIGFYLGQCIAFFICSAVALFTTLKKLIVFQRPDKELIRKMVRYGMSIIPANISSYFLLFVSSLIIHHYISQADLGYYQVGYTIASGILIITIPFNQAFQPISFSVMNKPEARGFYVLMLDIYCGVMSLICLILGLFLKEILHVLVTDKYEPSTFVAGVLSYSNFIYSINTIAVIGMAIQKKIKYFGIIVAVCNLLIIGLTYIGTRAGGINGTALSFVVGNFITIALLFFYSQKVLHLPYHFFSNALLIVGSFFVFYFAYWLTTSFTLYSFLIRLGLVTLFAGVLIVLYLSRKKSFQSITTYMQS